MHTRREFGQAVLAALAAARVAGAAEPKGKGVRVGVQTYSFRDLPRAEGSPDAADVLVRAMTESGMTDCELWSPHVEPRLGFAPDGKRLPADSPEGKKAREELRAWRLQTPLDHYRAIRKRFDQAGITISAFNYSFHSSFTDGEIDRGFEAAKALGSEFITASTTLSVARRVVPFAEKHQMVVAMHNHSNLTNPDEFATPESFAAARKMSKYFKTNLDIGHFTAAGFDPVAYLRANHEHITNLHVKDRKKDQGDNVPWGTGDTPIREVLQLVAKSGWPIRAHLEYEYKGTGTPVEEVRKCHAYVKQALA